MLERRLVSIMYKFDVVSSSFAGPLRVSVSDGNSITYMFFAALLPMLLVSETPILTSGYLGSTCHKIALTFFNGNARR